MLETGGIEQREVETGPHFAVQDVTGEAHLLTLLLEAGRREHIGDTLVDERCPERLGDLPSPGLEARGVAINPGYTPRGGELGGGHPEHCIHTGIVRLHERRDQLGRHRHPRPMVGREHINRLFERADRLPHRSDCDRDRGLCGLSQCDEETRVQRHVDRGDVMRAARAYGVDAEHLRLYDGGHGPKGDRDVRQLVRRLIDDAHLGDDRDGVLLEG